MSPTGYSQLYCSSQTPRGAAPFYMYENLSWIHDIHYIWGLPFCTPVTGTEFSTIRPPPHPLPLTVSPRFLSSLISFIPLPHALPLSWCFIPLQPFRLQPFHLSISQTFHPFILPILPSLSLTLPHVVGCEPARTVWQQLWGPAGPLSAVPPYVDLSPSIPYRFPLVHGKKQLGPGIIGTLLCRLKKRRGRGEKRGSMQVRCIPLDFIPPLYCA